MKAANDGSLGETASRAQLKILGFLGELRQYRNMRTVREIQDAIVGLPEPERLRLFNWIHSQEEALGNDPETLQEAQEGARQLDAGRGTSLEDARRRFCSPALPARSARPGNK